MQLTAENKTELLQLARHTLQEMFFPTSMPFKYSNSTIFSEQRGIFVTLKKNGELRGCIGNLVGNGSIYNMVESMAIHAAFRDPRFPPVTAEEWPMIRIEISVLSPMFPVTSVSEIVIGRDGLWLHQNGRSGVLLPKVAVEWNWNAAEFVSQVFYKAGLPENEWLPGEMNRFEADEFAE